MKHSKFIALIAAPLLITSCSCSTETNPTTTPEPDVPVSKYTDKKVNLYRKVGEIDKKIELRFYEDLPNVPYISVKEYYKEFFYTELTLKKNQNVYKYSLDSEKYVSFDVKNNIFASKGLRSFSELANSKSSDSTIFISLDEDVTTTEQEKVVNMNNYSISFYTDNSQAFAPLSFLSSLFGGISQYNVAYNGQDVYVLDEEGEYGDPTSTSAYGEQYLTILSDVKTDRTKDLAEYAYNELCFVFDNLRGYTEQLIFGDNNLVSLGLNGLLERYAPKVKEYLLSLDKENYLEGVAALFNGLYDGGHTGLLMSFEAMTKATDRKSEEEFVNLHDQVTEGFKEKFYTRASVIASRISELGSGSDNFFYTYNDTYKTSYIVFSNFVVDYEGWDNYYNHKGEIPVATDTYAFVRDSLYKAKEDGAENVVLDLSSNGGGSSFALEGVVGLLNGAKSNFNVNDTFNKYRLTEKHFIDINLDGVYNELDAEEANSFNFNIGVLTSYYSFSCGNLLPSVLKELGYKIMGDRSGGGSCAVAIDTTADGLEYVHSSFINLCNESGENIDLGVQEDFTIEHPLFPGTMLYNYKDYFNFELVSDYLSNAYL